MTSLVLIIMLLFIGAIMLALLAYSTSGAARASRVFMLCEFLLAATIFADRNAILCVIELVLYQILAIAFALVALYTTASYECEMKDSPSSDHTSTSLVVLPFKKDAYAVDQGTADSMANLFGFVQIACILTLAAIRAVMLFPFWEKGLAVFIISIAILFLADSIISSRGLRAIDDDKFNSNISNALTCFVLIMLIYFVVIGCPTFITYEIKDGHAAETISKSITAEYELKADAKGNFLTEYYGSDGYEYLEYHVLDESYANTLEGKYVRIKKADVKLHETNNETPHIEAITNYYMNIRGKEKVRDTDYAIYVPTGTIVWSK